MTILRLRGSLSQQLGLPLILGVVALAAAVTYAAYIFQIRNVRTQAIRQAEAVIAQTLATRAIYTQDVVVQLMADGLPIQASPDFADMAGSIPLPATLVRRISDRVNAQGLYQIDLVSPWPINPAKVPKSAWEQQALAALVIDPQTAQSRLETAQEKSRLLYMSADFASTEACVACHNSHPDSPRTDFEVGDMMGALIVEVPLTEDFAAARLLAAWLTMGILAGLSGFVVFVLWFQRRGVVRPVQQLVQTAGKLAQGDLATPVSIVGMGEINQLARSFEKMRASLKDSYTELERHVKELTALRAVAVAGTEADNEAELIERATQIIGEMLYSDHFGVLLVDDHAEALRVHSSYRGLTEKDRDRLIPLGSGIVGRVLANGQALRLSDVTQEPDYIETTPGMRSELCVPLETGGQVIGVLNAESSRLDAFTEADERLLSTFASQLATAAEKLRLYTQAQERLERISALHDIDVAIVSQLSLEETLDVLLEKVTERLGMDAAAIALINPLTSELKYAARRGLDGNFFIDGLLKVAEGVAGQVAHTGQPAFISDVREDERFVRRAVARQLDIVSYMAVPLRARGEVIGVLELAANQQQAYLPEEVDFFETLAGQAAIVLDNARMYAQALRRAAQARALAESAGSVLATLDVDALWPEVTRAARQALAVNRAAIYLYDPANDQLSCPYAEGLSNEYVAGLNRRFRQAPGGKLVSEPQTIIIADAQSDPATEGIRDLVAREGFHSYAIFPLPAPELPLGAFVVYRDEITPFSPDDVATGQTLAHIISVALQNTRLFETERAARQQAETLRVATQALSTTLDLQQVLDLILSELGRVVPYDSASVQQLKGERLEIIGGRGFPNLEALLGASFDVTAGDNPNGEVIRRRAPLILKDAPAIYEEFRSGPHAAAGIRSWLGAPLLFGDRLTGIIAIDKQEPGFYTEEHARLVAAFAAQAAVAIENARLYQQANQRLQELETLQRATQAVAAAPGLDMALEEVVAILASELGYQHVGIALVDEVEQRVELRAESGIPQAEWGVEGQGVKVGQGLVGWVAQHGEPLLVNDVSRDPRYLAGIPQARSELVVPLRTDERVIGVIDVESHLVDAFDADDLRLLNTLAGQLSTAIERARLFDETRRRVEELAALAQVSSALRQAENLEALRPVILRASLEVMGAQAGSIFLLDEAAQELYLADSYGYPLDVGGLRLKMGEGLAGEVAKSGRPIFIADIAADDRIVMSQAFDGLHKAMCMSLKSGEELAGVLLISFTARGTPAPAEIDLFASIAEMAGNAMRRAALHEQTLSDALELANAYETTLEGWARALELRDQETEGHTRRVTEMTERLVRAMGIHEEDLEHIRRGALLHDIGKMGVPDNVLLKPGQLSDHEWEIMRQHPVYAYNMLSAIEFLHPALDIPYSHHEKWDGSGYPRGLKGEDIPLPARVFAVVDVWDALNSDRPYRKAWPEEKVLGYLREQSGTHFDPRVMEVFLEVIEEQSNKMISP